MSDMFTPPSPARAPRPTAPPSWQGATPPCPASARDLLPVLDLAGLAVVLIDASGRVVEATSTLERLLRPDGDRLTLWNATRALVDELRRAPHRGLVGAGAPPRVVERLVSTANASYRVAASVPAVDVAAGGSCPPWAAVTIQRTGATPADGWPCAGRGLSAREQQVALLLAEGRTTAQVGAALGISAHTARHHTERVYEKLGVRSRAALGRMLAGVG